MPASRTEFERTILPHLAAGHSLARWLLRHPHDAEDAVQDAALKAFKAFGGYAGGNAKIWFLTIVRNTCLNAIESRRAMGKVVMLADNLTGPAPLRDLAPDPAPLADAAMITDEERRQVHTSIAALPLQYREVLVLREYHEMSYQAIADIVGAPIGTVMSRLARGRERLLRALDAHAATSKTGAKS
jgi:RNA polymerase sigma-70 factor (ECF subfamily)